MLMLVTAPRNPMEMGHADALADEPFAPEMYFVTHWQRKQYAQGFLQAQPYNETCRRALGMVVSNDEPEWLQWDDDQPMTDDEYRRMVDDYAAMEEEHEEAMYNGDRVQEAR